MATDMHRSVLACMATFGSALSLSQAVHAQALPVPEEGDRMGNVLASADFNGDGFLDLAVAIQDKDVNGKRDAGAVNVYYGPALSTANAQFWTQESIGIAGVAEESDRFGS